MRIALLLVLAAGMAFADGGFDLVRFAATDAEAVRQLESRGCVVSGPDTRVGGLLAEVPKAMVQALADEGWRFETVKPDIDEFYRQNALDYRYHTYTEIKDSFMLMAANNPSFVRFETLGFASNDSLLFALRITDNPNVEEDEPELLFEAAVHGDEKCATEPIFEWAAYLIGSYGIDPDVTHWVDNCEIWVHCVVNPHGHINGVRSNRNGYDCNRDYGFMWYYETSAREGFTQPETQAHARLALANCFTHWQSGHGGTYMISTPWSYAPFGTRDSMEIQYLAARYHDITGYPYGPGYRVMYQINGASKDYAYGAHGGIGWTVETCIYKTPPAESLAPIVAREHAAMRMVLANINRGVRGIVTDSVTGAPLRARVRPVPVDFPSFCDTLGDFHRYLRPGTYSLVFEANGYEPKTVTEVAVTSDTVTRVDVALAPDTTRPVALHRFVKGRGVSDVSMPATPDWALGEHDGRRFSLGRGGFADFDFGQLVFNLSGNDFTVFEEDGDPEGYRVEAANDWAGPWTVVGTGTGTQGFDLTAGGLSFCRYLRIVDDSSATSGPTAGFDLDAVEAMPANAVAVVLQDKVVVDSPPGGNANGRLDPDEEADLVLELRNVGRVGVTGVTGVLRTTDTLVTVLDSTGTFGELAPDSVRANWADRFRVAADPGTPVEHSARMVMLMTGTDFSDSVLFDLVVGELRTVDPVPDGPRQPSLYWAYDDCDSGYSQHPDFDWVEVSGVGTRLSLSDDDVEVVDLGAFGPFLFYGQSYSQLTVCSNGFVCPGSQSYSGYSNQPLPYSSAPAMLALSWDDMYPPNGGGVWYRHDADNHRFVVEFDSVHYYSSSVADKFELVLYDTTVATPTGDNAFTVQYLTANNYGSNTVGIQDHTRAVAIPCLCDGDRHRACAPLAAGRAIRYTTADPTGVAEPTEPGQVTGLALSCGPNPGSGPVQIRFQLPAAGPCRVQVLDVTGRVVRVLLDSPVRRLAAGRFRLAWDGTDSRGQRVSPGVYLVRVETASGQAGDKLVRLR